MNKRYKPKIDRLFYIIWVPTLLILAAATAVSCLEPLPLLIMLSVDIFTLYFLVSPLFGYVELRESSLFIKYGFIIKREIPYTKICGIKKEKRIQSEAMLSLKSALEHVKIKYNRFDFTVVSVTDNDGFMTELGWRMGTNPF